MEEVNNAASFLLANPMYLVPVLAIAAMMLYAILKKLIKLAAIVAIAGALYVVLVEYMGGGF
jgi:hypothetical protein